MNSIVSACLGGIIGIFAVIRFAPNGNFYAIMETFGIAFIAMFFICMFVATLISMFFANK